MKCVKVVLLVGRLSRNYCASIGYIYGRRHASGDTSSLV